MKQSHYDETEYTFLEDKARELGGYDDASLQREAADLERTQEKTETDGMADGDPSDEEIDARFELLRSRIQAEGIKSVSERRYEKEQKKNNRALRPRRRIRRKVIVVAAAAAVLAIGGGIVATAKGSYRYTVYPALDNREVTYIYNAAIQMPEGDMEKAYREISKKLKIPVMEFAYLPSSLYLVDFSLDGDVAILELQNDEVTLIIRMVAVSPKSFVNGSAADRVGYKTVLNNWMNSTIPIDRNVLENGQVEYSAIVWGESGYYSLEGKLDETEFLKIVENIYFPL